MARSEKNWYDPMPALGDADYGKAEKKAEPKEEKAEAPKPAAKKAPAKAAAKHE